MMSKRVTVAKKICFFWVQVDVIEGPEQLTSSVGNEDGE
jgi:hypothetical protein